MTAHPGPHTDRSRTAPARRGAQRSAGPGRLVGGGQQPRSRRLCGDRRHANPHVGPRLSPALPGRRQLEAVDRQCRSPGDRRRSGRPPRRGQRPRLGRRHLGGCQPAAQAARPPAPTRPRHASRPDHPPGDDASHHLVPVGPRGLGVRLRHRRGHCMRPRPGSPSALPRRSSRTPASTRASTTPSTSSPETLDGCDAGAAHRRRPRAPPPTARRLNATRRDDPPPRRPSMHGTLWS